MFRYEEIKYPRKRENRRRLLLFDVFGFHKLSDNLIRLFLKFFYGNRENLQSIFGVTLSIVLIFDCRSEHVAHIWSKSFISICRRHLIIKRVFKSDFFCFMDSCATCFKLTSYISAMIVSILKC